MTPSAHRRSTTGLAGPVAVFGGTFLLLAGPVLRGGHRAAPTVVLEWLGLAIIVAIVLRATWTARLPRAPAASPGKLPWLVALSPLALALIQLTPIPGAWWAQLAGREPFALAAQQIGLVQPPWQALSLSPDITRASLLAGIPMAAAFWLGHLASVQQLRTLLRCAAALCFLQVGLALLQMSGGQYSPFYRENCHYGRLNRQVSRTE